MQGTKPYSSCQGRNITWLSGKYCCDPFKAKEGAVINKAKWIKALIYRGVASLCKLGGAQKGQLVVDQSYPLRTKALRGVASAQGTIQIHLGWYFLFRLHLFSDQSWDVQSRLKPNWGCCRTPTKEESTLPCKAKAYYVTFLSKWKCSGETF